MNKHLLIALCATLISFFSLSAKAQGTAAPVFAAGDATTFSVCEGAAATSVNSLLEVNDADTAETLTWSALISPAHGTLVAAYATAATSGLVTPTGLTYEPTAGFSGTDTFSVEVNDGMFADTITVYVTVNPLPHAGTITVASSVCVAATTAVSSSVSGGTWSLTNTNATLSGTTITGASAGIDTIVYIFTNSCGNDTAWQAITINPLPDAGTITAASSVCVAATATISSSVSGGSWSLTNANATLTGTTLTGTTAGIDTIVYIVSNSCGDDTAWQAITINPLPDAGTITAASSVCVAATTTVSSSVSGGSWSLTNANATLTGTTLTGASAGIDTIVYVVSNTCGDDTAWQAITINPLPAAGTITAASSVCVAATATVSSSVSGGSWSLTNSRATLSGTTLTGVSAGIDTIVYVVTNSCGSDTARRAITINPLPNAGTISGPSSVCVGSTITLTTTGSGGSWSSSNATANITAAGLVTGLAAGIDTITYFAVNGCGVAYTTAIITINPLPSAGTISSASAVCIGSSIAVSSSVSGGSWSLTNANASLSGTTVTGVTAGVDTIKYVFTNVCGSDSTMRSITVSPVATAGTITGPSVVCEGATITDTASVTGGTWHVTTGAASVAAGVVTGVAGGTDTVLYVVSNSCSADTARHAITVNPLPAAGTLSGPSTVCVGASITISATLAGGTWSATNASASLADSVVTGVAGGIDTIHYSFTNACGTRSATHIVTILTVPNAGPITGPDRVCVGSTISLSAPSSASWSASNSNATITSAGAVTGITYGRDTITNIATNACGSDTAHHIVRIDTAAPEASMITGPFIVCVGDTIRVSDSVSGGVWAMSNTHATINSTGRIRGVSAGLDTVIYRLTNGCGADTVYYGITVNPLPNAGTITGYDSVCLGSHITLHDAVTGGLWLSSNPAFADVDTAGVVSGYLFGSANIYYIVSNSCGSDSAVKHVNVNIPAPPIFGSPTLCQGATSILINTLPGGTWSTTLAGYFVVGPLIMGSVIGITVGTATVTYTVRNACGTTTSTFDVEVIVCDSSAGVNDVKNTASTIGVYPNPGSGQFTVTLPFGSSDMADVTVTNMVGEQVKALTMPGNKATDIQLNLPAGVYMLSATLNHERYTTRVVITE